jgi:hypothetical protein
MRSARVAMRLNSASHHRRTTNADPNYNLKYIFFNIKKIFF